MKKMIRYALAGIMAIILVCGLNVTQAKAETFKGGWKDEAKEIKEGKNYTFYEGDYTYAGYGDYTVGFCYKSPASLIGSIRVTTKGDKEDWKAQIYDDATTSFYWKDMDAKYDRATNRTTFTLTVNLKKGYNFFKFTPGSYKKATVNLSLDVNLKNKPSINKARITSKTVNTISWGRVSGASAYQVYRASSKSGTYSKIGATTATNFKDKRANSRKKYYYKVRAYKKIGSKTYYSKFSQPVLAK